MKKYQTEEERKEAKRQYDKQRYQANREKRLEQWKQWYEANKEKTLEYKKQCYETNKEKVLEQKKQYYQKNQEQKKQSQKQYRQTQFGRASNLVNGYKREDKKYNRGECTLTAQWVMDNIFNSKCIYCGESDWHKLGCDRKDNSLPHTPSNVVCCCANCNTKRGRKEFEDFLAECE